MNDLTLRQPSRLVVFFAQVRRKASGARRAIRRTIEQRDPQTPEEFKYSTHIWMLRAGFACVLIGVVGKFLRPTDAFWERLIEWSLLFMAGKFSNHVGTSLIQKQPEHSERKTTKEGEN